MELSVLVLAFRHCGLCIYPSKTLYASFAWPDSNRCILCYLYL
jgi:hypothetical protein